MRLFIFFFPPIDYSDDLAHYREDFAPPLYYAKPIVLRTFSVGVPKNPFIALQNIFAIYNVSRKSQIYHVYVNQR